MSGKKIIVTAEIPEITDVDLATVRLERAIKERKKEHKHGNTKT